MRARAMVVIFFSRLWLVIHTTTHRFSKVSIVILLATAFRLRFKHTYNAVANVHIVETI